MDEQGQKESLPIHSTTRALLSGAPASLRLLPVQMQPPLTLSSASVVLSFMSKASLAYW